MLHVPGNDGIEQAIFGNTDIQVESLELLLAGAEIGPGLSALQRWPEMCLDFFIITSNNGESVQGAIPISPSGSIYQNTNSLSSK